MPARLSVLLVLVVFTTPAFGDWAKGLEAYEAGDKQTAFDQWSTAAEEGDSNAQYNLGFMYLQGVDESGETIVRQDSKRAIHYMTLAAAQDHQEATYYLGIFYTGGSDIDQNLAQAYCWFERSARSGYARGFFALGKMNFEGMGRDKDLVKAHAFLTLASTMDHEPSKRMLELVLEEMTDLSQVDASIAFINEWGASDAVTPKCDLPEVDGGDGS